MIDKPEPNKPLPEPTTADRLSAWTQQFGSHPPNQPPPGPAARLTDELDESAATD